MNIENSFKKIPTGNLSQGQDSLEQQDSSKNIFEEKKTEFLGMTSNFFDSVYSGSAEPMQGFRFLAFIENNTSSLERVELTQIFVDKLRKTTTEYFFLADFDKEKYDQFHKTLYQNLFSMSPNILSYLSFDVPQYLEIVGELQKTPSLSYVTEASIGEITLEIAFNDNNSAVESITKHLDSLEQKDQISYIKTLSGVAQAGLFVGNFGEKSHTDLRNILIELSQSEISPFLSYFLEVHINELDISTSHSELGIHAEPSLSYSRDRKKSIETKIKSDHLLEHIDIPQLDSWTSHGVNIQQVAKGSYSLLSKNMDSSTALFQYIDSSSDVSDKQKAMLADYDVLFGGASELMSTLHTPRFSNILDKNLGINIADMYLNEQVQFLSYLADTKTENWNQLESVLKNKDLDSTNILRSFLSIDKGGPEMGQKILDIAEKLPAESANMIFQKYTEIVDATESVKSLLEKSTIQDISPEMIIKAQDFLLHRGKSLLDTYAAEAETCEGESCIEIGKALVTKLSLARESIYAFSAACRVLIDNGNFNFEDLTSTDLIYENSPIASEARTEIINMHTYNTEQYPESLKKYARDGLVDGLDNYNEHQKIICVKHEENIISVMRTIEQEDGSYYGASFNVNPFVQGSRIGTELLKEVIKNLSKDKPFVADCYAESPMLKNYIETFGFEITDTYDDYHRTGVKVYQITRFPEKQA